MSRPVSAPVRARRLLKLDEHDKAIERLQEISKKFAGEPASEEADYFLGWLALQDGKLQPAADALESFEKKHPESRRRDEACFFRALAQIRSGNWSEADRALRELYRRCGAILYVGHRSHQHLERLGSSATRLFFSPYCVDASTFEYDEAKLQHFPCLVVGLENELGEEVRVISLTNGKVVQLGAAAGVGGE